MSHRQDTSLTPAPGQSKAAVSVQRAVNEVRNGRIVCIAAENGDYRLILAAENITDSSLLNFRALSTGLISLILTQQRAGSLDLSRKTFNSAMALALPPAINTAKIQQLANPLFECDKDFMRSIQGEEISAQCPENAGLELMKISRLLPAVLITSLQTPNHEDLHAWSNQHDMLYVQAHDIFHSEQSAAQTLIRVSEASVPLKDAEHSRVIAYRPFDGGQEHLAIIIGKPQLMEKNPLVRLHSQCFTGDILGSLRCDCGDQLRGAIQAIANDGAGVLLYLAQEGRGIGLVNKLRAYVLQDQGADTLEANEHLGFNADERVYLPAAAMLKDLQLTKIRLLTNNPNKIKALTEAEIEVVERVPHAFPSNHHNEQYLHTKKTKAGHLL